MSGEKSIEERLENESHSAHEELTTLMLEAVAEIRRLREMFDITRHRVLKAMGVDDLGHGWFWVESTISDLRRELAAETARREAAESSRDDWHRVADERSRALNEVIARCESAEAALGVCATTRSYVTSHEACREHFTRYPPSGSGETKEDDR